MPQQETPGNGAMEGSGVYGRTTEPIQGAGGFCNCACFNTQRCVVKVLEVVFSFLAFVLEEVVAFCEICHALYFFEFVSCSAFFLTLLLLIILTTSLKQKVDRVDWKKVDFYYTAVIAIFFLIASIVFAAKNEGSDVEKAAVAFGFLASFAFMVDLVLYLKEEKWPVSRKETTPAETTRGPENVKGEMEPLNESGNVPV
ncbi:CKLF-like MARVEL transmembrane domain-containing protein 6 [Pristis pectinata]|uniref:CKLF-like MARVEL transmembrane domain-containing protein 6 n=1 Tax=Pristis pectinata TaxID=685728 RepID=UPI00223D29A2|nr:CKLF-like MARVEL transmembrane domain-containing protein 6 [Pristis pectinata]XP_051872392.1 CKLF-like MARVEL transmembrane domain-containing protein 6 [Pristis pectinata]XP_051872393.1 CKLF-like MARVEL transmembrane domain-containing protein 6 [Pristis pectinata]XP_051872394.1 CKLF-like MARVEL transmembrane domain-containing protein 6 [Pristis pectinata]XP_051872395.1 CKLF-like MARVEL transmembrane domain-containing protein 6 [Pristis pectinata]